MSADHDTPGPAPRSELKKGVMGGLCNRTACQAPGAVYFNRSTLRYYCEACAELLNRENADEAQRLFGGPLCVFDPPAPSLASGATPDVLTPEYVVEVRNRLTADSSSVRPLSIPERMRIVALCDEWVQLRADLSEARSLLRDATPPKNAFDVAGPIVANLPRNCVDNVEFSWVGTTGKGRYVGIPPAVVVNHIANAIQRAALSGAPIPAEEPPRNSDAVGGGR
jgi:hypothetical protein